jgi:acetyl/propionyl-CoA carboxylase alpha subunit
MDLIARRDGRTERIAIERAADGSGHYRVEIDGRAHDVDVRSLGPFVKSLLVDGESHEVAVFRVGEGTWRVGWRGHATTVELVDPLTHLAVAGRGENAKSGKLVVTAYMPGRVVSVAVEAGAAVEPGQPLVVLEAMKMQNEIQADRAGTVVRIHVAPGQAVEGGDPLVELG